MSTFILMGVTLALVGVGVLWMTNRKVKSRLKARGRDFSNAVADSIGDVTDDRRDAIDTRRTKNNELEKKLTSVLVNIKQNKANAQAKSEEAKKYAALAKSALKAGKRDAAREYLELQEVAEEAFIALLLVVETLQGDFDTVKAQLDESRGEVETAEAQSAAFEARHAALELRQEMEAAAGCFGDNSLDFSEYENELKTQELQLEAAEEMSRTAGQNAIAEFEKSQSQAELDDKLSALEAELQAEKPTPVPQTAEAPAPAVEPPVSSYDNRDTYSPSDDSSRFSGGGYGGGSSSYDSGGYDSGGCDSGGCD